jgi:hypothetical protein
LPGPRSVAGMLCAAGTGREMLYRDCPDENAWDVFSLTWTAFAGWTGVRSSACLNTDWCGPRILRACLGTHCHQGLNTWLVLPYVIYAMHTTHYIMYAYYIIYHL